MFEYMFIVVKTQKWHHQSRNTINIETMVQSMIWAGRLKGRRPQNIGEFHGTRWEKRYTSPAKRIVTLRSASKAPCGLPAALRMVRLQAGIAVLGPMRGPAERRPSLDGSRSTSSASHAASACYPPCTVRKLTGSRCNVPSAKSLAGGKV